MIVTASAKIYDLKLKGYVKETKEEQFIVHDKSEATEFNIFQANYYVKMVLPEREYILTDINITKREVN